MCTTCGCSVTPGNRELAFRPVAKGATTVTVLQNLLAENDHVAEHNRRHLDTHGILAVNLMSSPGAGKTTLLEATLQALRGEFRMAVIEGDLETENDAQRIRAQGVPAVQITTGNACHLDAHMVHGALHELSLDNLDLLFIENVGNLVCPASFDLGQHRNVTLLSVTEGDDKPEKYPIIFRGADAILITKSDLLPVLDDFDTVRASAHVRRLASNAPLLTLSARRPPSLRPWLDWLRTEVTNQRVRLARGDSVRPRIQPDEGRLHAASP